MALDFYIIDEQNKNYWEGKHVGLEEELGVFLYKNREVFDDEISVFIELDPYDDTILETNDIKRIYNVCEPVLEDHALDRYEDKEYAYKFFTDIKSLCEEALEKGRRIIAIGD